MIDMHTRTGLGREAVRKDIFMLLRTRMSNQPVFSENDSSPILQVALSAHQSSLEAVHTGATLSIYNNTVAPLTWNCRRWVPTCLSFAPGWASKTPCHNIVVLFQALESLSKRDLLTGLVENQRLALLDL